MTKKIYLASPYSHMDIEIRQWRAKQAMKAAAFLMRKGKLVFSPIAHSHPIACKYALPGNFDFWHDWCISFITTWATDLYILMLPDWQKSVGVQAELKVAQALKLPITYMGY